MDEIKPVDTLSKTAKIISSLFHPVFIPLYGLMLIFLTPTIYGYLPFTAKKYLFFLILNNNVNILLLLILFLRIRNQISSWEMESKQERMMPLFLATILYAVTSYIILRYPTSVFIKAFIIGIFFISSSITVINNWWKVSIHAAGAGALTALALLLSFRMYNVIIWPLLMVIILSGLILTSRLRLGSHSSAQVWVGFLLGFIELGILYRMI